MSLNLFFNIDQFGLALYGFKLDACPIQDLYQLSLDTLALFGCQAQLAGANIGGKSSGRYRSFRSVDKKLRSTNFASVTNWCCRSDPDELVGAEDVHHSGELMTICYSNEPSSRRFILTIREELVRDRMDLLLETAKKVCVLLGPIYGIGYRKKSSFIPDLFGMGMRGNGDFDPACDHLVYWSMLARHDVFCLLRDVFPWNFLTATLLDIKIENGRLEDWILSNPNHGYLTSLTDQVTLWTIADVKLPLVRDKLKRAGVIFDRDRDFVSKMREYNVGDMEVLESIKTGKPLVHQPSSPGLSDSEMLAQILNTFGTPESTVLVKSDDGKLRPVKKKKGGDTNKKKGK